MGIVVHQKGSFKRTRRFLKNAPNPKIMKALEQYAMRGCEALAEATPERSGITANSWEFEIAYDGSSAKINWINTNVNQGQNIALLIQYGHGTGTGGYVEGYDYINPAVQPIFDEIAEELWNEVKSA